MYLARCCSGNTINMFQIDRYLIILHQSRHLFPAPFIILFRQAANDESLHDFSHHIIMHTDACRLLNTRNGVQGLFDLNRTDFFPADIDNLLFTAFQVYIAGVINVAPISGFEIAVLKIIPEDIF